MPVYSLHTMCVHILNVMFMGQNIKYKTYQPWQMHNQKLNIPILTMNGSNNIATVFNT